MMINDPIEEYVRWLREHAEELNQNISAIKAMMSIQNMQNESFINDISDIHKRLDELENQLESE